MAVLAAFAPTLDNDWMGWDDPQYFLTNPHYRGLGWPQLKWMFGSAHFNQYAPVAWLTLGLDHVLWGMQPWGYHLTSLLIHAFSALLFFGLSCRLITIATKRDDSDTALAAAVAALLWAIHPLRVESVAWIAERRDVLSGLFFIATLWLYVDAPESSRARAKWLAAAVAAYALSLLSKATAVTLPVILLLLDYYLLRKKRSYAEKIPFFAIAGAITFITWRSLKNYGALHGLAEYGLAPRLAKAAYNLTFYPLRTIWPGHLLPHYEAPIPFIVWKPEFIASAAAVALIGLIAWRLRKRWPAVPIALACYAVTLAPVSGLVRAGIDFLAADRFGYLPSLSLTLLGAAGFLVIIRRARSRRSALLTVLAVIALLGKLTWKQTVLWKDSLTLWGHVLAVQPRNAVANNNYGAALGQIGDHDGALRHCSAALLADPLYMDANDNRAQELFNLGRYAEARSAFEMALRLRPSVVNYEYAGVSSLRAGDSNAALGYFEKALRFEYHPALNCRQASALEALKRRHEAIKQYQACLEADPSLVNARVDYGRTLMLAGRHGEAIEQFRKAIYGKSDLAAAHANWAEAVLLMGQAPVAERHARESLRLSPALIEARLILGNAFTRQGRLLEASAEYRGILRIAPEYRAASHNLRAISGALKK